MADNRLQGFGCAGDKPGAFKEAVCIDTNRIYDSCADKDCLEDLKVYFTDCTQRIVDRTTAIRCRKAEIINCAVDVEEVPFNKGCFSVDITFFFKLTFDAYSAPAAPPMQIHGLAVFSKKCILFGGEGSVKVFTSEFKEDEFDDQGIPFSTNPTAKVQCVDPIPLSAIVREVKRDCCCPCCNVPGCVNKQFEGSFEDVDAEREVLATLGLFTIVQLERDVQLLIPAYDFCMPKKECSCDTESPCEIFRKIKFPVGEFFPVKDRDCITCKKDKDC